MSHLADAVRAVLVLCSLGISGLSPAHAADGETLAGIRARGVLRCGVSEGVPGFSARDASGRWTGLDADFCRAVAAAALGDAAKVTFVPLRASARFPALNEGMVDLLARNTTWTLVREGALKVQFAGVLFYDAQAFLVPRSAGVQNVAALKGATVCVEKGTSTDAYLRATGGSGKRFLLLLLLLVAPVCAFLPNATTVILLAPIIVRVCIALEADYVGPMVLTAIISNSAGLLTLVGDPATFLIGSSIGMSFTQYLRQVSLGGMVAILVIVPMLPWLMRDLWTMQRTLPPPSRGKRLERPVYAALAVAVLLLMMALFVFGEHLPTHIVPPAAAVIASALALLVGFAARIEPTESVLRDVDWKTLLFLASIFCLVEAMVKTGLLQTLAIKLYEVFGHALTPVSLTLIVGIALLSSVLANVPVAAASIVMVKGYLIMAEVVPDTAMAAHFSQWPAASIPVFVAMMFGATLGGNATLVGASANIVAAGVCARQGTPVTFGTFLRYGLPITLAQLAASAIYVLVMFALLR